MEFDHILIRYGELALKGRNQKHFLNKLQQNVQHKLKAFPNIQVKRTQGRMFILLNGEDPQPIIDKVRRIFGIHSLSLAIKVQNELPQIEQAALYALKQSDAKTFKVSVRRVNKSFPKGSQEMNQHLGAHLLRHTEGIEVDVHNPDVEVKVEIRVDATYITSQVIPGAGGLPVGTSGKTLLLLSGGIDSPVAGYMMMKRGVELEAIHFHSPPFTSDRAKQKVIDLAEKLTAFGHRLKIHVVPFTTLQQKLFQEIPDGYAMTVMRRMMFQISEAVCRKQNILSMATGESLGQVASQTMESMHTINEVTNYPILRPLVAMDKQEIIKISKDIDTYDISIRPYEDCCTIFVPKSPKTKPKRDKVNQFEAGFDFQPYIDEAVENIETIIVTDEKPKDDLFEELF
ncbi:MAG TPA: tRNA uracil 4-sulfurtransferase ThiI [Cerasibacillus sp.]|uniref:tRNA uracil 4-sulfurtransferase ThiI n=1 Tax=Cerasibacillus sp. TaxID=2498711 RepID=UPI002F42E1CA